MKWVPFTVHVKIVPNIEPSGTGKRQEILRSMQKIGKFIFDEIVELTNYSLATPGGGQHMSYGGRGAFSGLTNGCAVKPQMGSTPAQAMITGFYQSSTDITGEYPYAYKTIFSGGEQYTGEGNRSYENTTNTLLDADVKQIKTDFETAFTALPVGTYKVFRIEYAGVIFGDRGFSYPA